MTPEDQRPLRPLVYTVQPDQTSELAAAREERLLAQLNDDPLDTTSTAPTQRPNSAETLGHAMFSALTSRDERAFRALWHDAESVALERGIPLDVAQDQIDTQRGSSHAFWGQFDPGRPSEKHPGGLADVLHFATLKLGDKTHGTFQGNVFTVVVANTELAFSFDVPDILVSKDGTFGLASAIEPNTEFTFFRQLGLHLRPGVLAPDTYWYPASVGNFWRYRLTDREITRDFGQFERGLEDADGATTKTVQVETVERFGSRRLVTFRVSYDDADETVVREKWLMLPSAIYLCDVNCEATVASPKRLLDHLRSATPLLQQPLRIGATWGTDFEIVGVNDVNVPMGRFDGVLRIRANASVGMFDPKLFHPQTIWFKPSVGIIERRVERPQRPMEVLIEYRLMPL